MTSFSGHAEADYPDQVTAQTEPEQSRPSPPGMHNNNTYGTLEGSSGKPATSAKPTLANIDGGEGEGEHQPFFPKFRSEEQQMQGQAEARGVVVTWVFWIHVVVAVVLMAVLLRLIDLNEKNALTSTFTVTLLSLSYELPALGSMSAVNIFIATVVTTVVAVVLAWVWMAASRKYPLFLIYLSLAMSPVSSLTLAAYSFYRDKLFVGGMLVYVTSVLIFLFWQWRSRIPYAVQLLRTTVTFLQAYPGPVRVVFWDYFASLGALLAVTLIESLTLRIIVMGFYIFSSFWASAVVTGILRVVSAGVCSDWYAGHGHDSSIRSNPTRFYVKQSMTSSFNAIALASLVGFDLRTTRASYVALRNSCCSCFGHWVSGIDRIIPYCNRYAFSQIATHDKPYLAAAKGTWDVMQGVSAVLDDNLLAALLPLSVMMVGVLSLIPGLIVMYVLENDYYLLAGFLSYSSGCAVMSPVLQVTDSAAVTIILCFAEQPEILEREYPLLYARFRSLCDPMAQSQELTDLEHQQDKPL